MKEYGMQDAKAKREAILRERMRMPKTPWPIKILAVFFGLFFLYLFVSWVIWALFSVVIPRLTGG